MQPSTQLHHLPRAERLLKDYVDVQIQQLMEHSDAVSNKYMASRQEYLAKSKANSRLKMQIQNLLAVMSSALSLPQTSREVFPEVQGLCEEEIRMKVTELSKLLEMFPQGTDKNDDGEVNREGESPQEMQASQADLNELPLSLQQISKAKSPPNRSKPYIALLMHFLQGAGCLAGLSSIGYFLLTHLF